MAEIPLENDYLKKRHPDKSKENCKRQSACSTPKNKNKVEKSEQQIVQEMIEAADKIHGDEIQYILYGGIEWPTEFDGLIIEEPKNAEEYVKSQTAWLAKASAYIAMHLKRWVDEKVVDKIYYWYKNVSSPFTKRMMPIKQPCEDLLNVLPARLPTFQQRFREKYEQMLSVAEKAEGKLVYRLDKDINDFKLAAKDLYEIVMMIHSEALMAVKANLAEKPAETEQGAILVILQKTWTCVRKVPRWIYFLVVFLAALLTSIYLLWWLWTTFWKK